MDFNESLRIQENAGRRGAEDIESLSQEIETWRFYLTKEKLELKDLEEFEIDEPGGSQEIQDARENVARLEQLLAAAETKRALLLNKIAG